MTTVKKKKTGHKKIVIIIKKDEYGNKYIFFKGKRIYIDSDTDIKSILKELSRKIKKGEPIVVKKKGRATSYRGSYGRLPPQPKYQAPKKEEKVEEKKIVTNVNIPGNDVGSKERLYRELGFPMLEYIKQARGEKNIDEEIRNSLGMTKDFYDSFKKYLGIQQGKYYSNTGAFDPSQQQQIAAGAAAAVTAPVQSKIKSQEEETQSEYKLPKKLFKGFLRGRQKPTTPSIYESYGIGTTKAKTEDSDEDIRELLETTERDLKHQQQHLQAVGGGEEEEKQEEEVIAGNIPQDLERQLAMTQHPQPTVSSQSTSTTLPQISTLSMPQTMPIPQPFFTPLPTHQHTIPEQHTTIHVVQHADSAALKSPQPIQIHVQAPVQQPVQAPVQQPVQAPIQQLMQPPVQQPAQHQEKKIKEDDKSEQSVVPKKQVEFQERKDKSDEPKKIEEEEENLEESPVRSEEKNKSVMGKLREKFRDITSPKKEEPRELIFGVTKYIEKEPFAEPYDVYKKIYKKREKYNYNPSDNIIGDLDPNLYSAVYVNYLVEKSRRKNEDQTILTRDDLERMYKNIRTIYKSNVDKDKQTKLGLNKLTSDARKTFVTELEKFGGAVKYVDTEHSKKTHTHKKGQTKMSVRDTEDVFPGLSDMPSVSRPVSVATSTKDVPAKKKSTKKKDVVALGKKYTSDDEQGLADYEIDEMMKGKSHYVGTLNIEDIEELDPENKMGFCLFLPFDNDDETGHWVAVYIDSKDSKSIEYYDPYGEDPPEEVMEELKKLVDKYDLPYLLKFKVNKVKNQRVNSDSCGYFSVLFLKDRFDGVPFSDTTGFSNVMEAEHNIKKYKDHYKKFGYL